MKLFFLFVAVAFMLFAEFPSETTINPAEQENIPACNNKNKCINKESSGELVDFPLFQFSPI